MDPDASIETEIDRQISLHHISMAITLIPEPAIAPISSEENYHCERVQKGLLPRCQCSFRRCLVRISSTIYVLLLSRRRLRDTVSSVGVFHNKYYPGAELADNICFFRHALALDERRVKFLPEYVVAKKEDFLPGESGRPAKCKEVWFRGYHSDVWVPIHSRFSGRHIRTDI